MTKQQKTSGQTSLRDEWRVRKLVDEDTGQHFLWWTFPTETGGIGEHRVSFKLGEKPKQLIEELLEYGAKFPTDSKEGFLRELLDKEAENKTGAFLTRTSGYRKDKGFVFPHGPGVGDIPSEIIWDSEAAQDLPIGRTRGTLAGWNERVGRVCEHSDALAFAVMATLAGPCLRDTNLPETAVFNFAGPSSTGKTTLTKVAASVYGAPTPLPSWNSTPRGLEELAALHNYLVLILNDTESFPEDATALRQALKAAAQTIPEGQSKTRSKAVSGRNKQVPALRWHCFGISTSIKTAEDLAREANSTRSEGERVRLIDIPVQTREQGGIFDLQAEDGAAPIVQQSKALIDQLEAALLEEHGSLIRPWIEYLLEYDIASILDKHMAGFVTHGRLRDSCCTRW